MRQVTQSLDAYMHAATIRRGAPWLHGGYMHAPMVMNGHGHDLHASFDFALNFAPIARDDIQHAEHLALRLGCIKWTQQRMRSCQHVGGCRLAPFEEPKPKGQA